MLNVTSEDLERILATIKETLSLHDEWREGLSRVLICQLPLTALDITEGAHQRCAFGRWFYSTDNSHLRDLPAFKKIGELYQAMHDNSREVCLKIKDAGLVAIEDYDFYLGSVAQFREELVGLHRRVAHTLQNIDPLTGAFSHAQLLPNLKAEQQRLKESGAQCSLLLIDFDLKEINKSHGHEIGNKVLRAAILCIREALSPGDNIYRYVGAEFVVCLPGKSTGDAELVKEMLLQKIGEALVETAGEQAIALHVHNGAVELNPDTHLEELLDRSARSSFTITIPPSSAAISATPANA